MEQNGKNKLLHPRGRLLRGIFLPHFKSTAEVEAVVMQEVKTVKIPLKQHIGAPSKPIVKKEDKVFVGTLIAEADGNVSAAAHSSVSGMVKDVTSEYIIIESDGEFTRDESLKPHNIKTKKGLVDAAKGCGLVGLGGAGFPTSVKLSTTNKIETLIINAAECEPYITVDYRECMENYDDIIDGVCLVKKILDIPEAVICVESNKPKAIEKLLEVIEKKEDDSIKVIKLPTLYPQGAEKMIVYSATGKKVPIGKLPADIGCMVMNVTSISVLNRYITTGEPLVARRITVDGTAVTEPKNIVVPIGTSVADILDFVGICEEGEIEVFYGGPMMGISVTDVNNPIDKRNNALTVLKADPKANKSTACINCGRCAGVCPMQLYPGEVDRHINHGRTDVLAELNINCCMECGSCSFVCPAKRPLVMSMRIAKEILRKESSK